MRAEVDDRAKSQRRRARLPLGIRLSLACPESRFPIERISLRLYRGMRSRAFDMGRPAESFAAVDASCSALTPLQRAWHGQRRTFLVAWRAKGTQATFT